MEPKEPRSRPERKTVLPNRVEIVRRLKTVNLEVVEKEAKDAVETEFYRQIGVILEEENADAVHIFGLIGMSVIGFTSMNAPQMGIMVTDYALNRNIPAWITAIVDDPEVRQGVLDLYTDAVKYSEEHSTGLDFRSFIGFGTI